MFVEIGTCYCTLTSLIVFFKVPIDILLHVISKNEMCTKMKTQPIVSWGNENTKKDEWNVASRSQVNLSLL
jgi:hypothetical protein